MDHAASIPVTSYPLYRPGTEELFLARLLNSSRGLTLSPLEGHEPHFAQAAQALAWLSARLTVALALWAVPEVPEGAFPAGMAMVPGANPFRLQALLLEHEIRDGAGPNVGANAWRQDMLDAGDRNWTLGSLLRLMSVALAPSPAIQGARPREDELRRQVGWRLEQLSWVTDEAARLRTHGLAVESRAPVGPAALIQARNVLHNVLVRHVDGRPLETPVLTRADLLMLASSRSVEARELVVTLAPAVAVAGVMGGTHAAGRRR